MNGFPHDKPLVLVIGDDEAICAYLSALLEDNAVTIEASNGEKGIALAKSRLPDLILLNLMMPGTDGYQVCKTLKANRGTNHIPIVFITAQEDRAFEAAAIKLGAIDCIVKTFDTDIVAAKVKNCLNMLKEAEALNPALQRRQNSKRMTAFAVAAGVMIAVAVGILGTQFLSERPSTPQPAPPQPVASTPAASPAIATPAVPTRAARPAQAR